MLLDPHVRNAAAAMLPVMRSGRGGYGGASRELSEER
jgi:hypothetical protein